MSSGYIDCLNTDLEVGDVAGDSTTGIAGLVVKVADEDGLRVVYFDIDFNDEWGEEHCVLDVGFFPGRDGFYRAPREGEEGYEEWEDDE